MNGNDISLIITICVFPFLLLVCAALFVTRFSHPDDDTGIAPKLIAIVLMAFAFTTTIAVPASGANGSGATDISDDVLFQTFSGVTVALVVLVAPFSIFFFNAIFVKYGGDNLSKRIVKSLVGTSVCLAVYLVVLLPIFFSASDRSLSLLEYAIAVMDFIAWFPFCVLLGIGLVALPATLFCYWKYRPSPMQREDYDACRKALGARARQLYASGQEVLKRFCSPKQPRRHELLLAAKFGQHLRGSGQSRQGGLLEPAGVLPVQRRQPDLAVGAPRPLRLLCSDERVLGRGHRSGRVGLRAAPRGLDRDHRLRRDNRFPFSPKTASTSFRSR
ncbi:hypothetical protein MHBO_001130 [Bonamia ostreae]|uniref:Uncharacterized protein n=1 Tax=Bonamia ostreae TaxID=126728 RepID=A0ABV2AHW9_9EUKA